MSLMLLGLIAANPGKEGNHNTLLVTSTTVGGFKKFWLISL
jgi:hypothetical protein